MRPGTLLFPVSRKGEGPGLWASPGALSSQVLCFFFHSEEIFSWLPRGQPTNTAGIPKVQSLQLDFFFLFLCAKCLLCEPQYRTGGNGEALPLPWGGEVGWGNVYAELSRF